MLPTHAFEFGPALLHVHEAAAIGVALHPLLGLRIEGLRALANLADAVMLRATRACATAASLSAYSQPGLAMPCG